MKQLLSLLTFGVFLCTNLFAQSNNCNRLSLGANFTITMPFEDMESNGYHTNYGATFNTLYNLTPDFSLINFHVGGRITGGVTKGKRDNITLESPNGASARSSIYNTLADLLVTGRMVLNPQKKIQFYFDAYAGGRFTGAQQGIRLDRYYPDYERNSSDKLVQSANWAWGTGSGILIQVKKNLYFDLGVNYMQSAAQKFVNLDSYSSKSDLIQYDLVSSKANSYGIHIGIHATLGCNRSSSPQEKTSRKNRKKRKVKKRKPKTKKPSNS